MADRDLFALLDQYLNKVERKRSFRGNPTVIPACTHCSPLRLPLILPNRIFRIIR